MSSSTCCLLFLCPPPLVPLLPLLKICLDLFLLDILDDTSGLSQASFFPLSCDSASDTTLRVWTGINNEAHNPRKWQQMPHFANRSNLGGNAGPHAHARTRRTGTGRLGVCIRSSLPYFCSCGRLPPDLDRSVHSGHIHIYIVRTILCLGWLSDGCSGERRWWKRSSNWSWHIHGGRVLLLM